MAYCPKCGVEVNNDVRSCPLCSFDIPDISEGADTGLIPVSKYPEVKNIYNEYLIGIKAQVCFIVMVLLISAILSMLVIENVFNLDTVIIRYFYGVAVALGAYTYFGLGFHNWHINIAGMGITTALLTLNIARISGGTWYTSYALPLTLLAYFTAVGFHFLYTHSVRRNRLGYLPALVLLIAACLCIGVDGIISWNLHEEIYLTWSLVAAVGFFCVAFILQLVINHIPDSTKETIRRKLHL